MKGLAVIIVHVLWASAIFAVFISYYPVQYSEMFTAWGESMLWIIIVIGLMTIGYED